MHDNEELPTAVLVRGLEAEWRILEIVVENSISSDEELRGWASRQMLAEDARWAMDVILSAQRAPDIVGYIPLLLGHHFVRIAYEGAIALRSANPHVGVPGLAALVSAQYAAITARARHTSKLLDDTKKSYDEVVLELDSILKQHREQLTGNAAWWARWLETDMGLYLFRGNVAGATVPASYRLGLDISDSGVIAGENLLAVSEEWGGTLVALGGAALDGVAPVSTMDLKRGGKVAYRDRVASRYFNARFEPDFSYGLKALLLMIEGDLATALTFLQYTAIGHEQAVFRARTITLYHSLTAIRRILERFPGMDTESAQRLRGLLSDAPTQRLLSDKGRRIRNRCMHYEISDAAIRIIPSSPMFGIVESVDPDTTWERFECDVVSVASRLVDLLREWKPATRGR